MSTAKPRGFVSSERIWQVHRSHPSAAPQPGNGKPSPSDGEVQRSSSQGTSGCKNDGSIRFDSVWHHAVSLVSRTAFSWHLFIKHPPASVQPRFPWRVLGSNVTGCSPSLLEGWHGKEALARKLRFAIELNRIFSWHLLAAIVQSKVTLPGFNSIQAAHSCRAWPVTTCKIDAFAANPHSRMLSFAALPLSWLLRISSVATTVNQL